MIDKRIGKRIKQCRERLGLSQEAFAEKTGLTPNYISTVERGMSFPRCEKLIVLLNGLVEVIHSEEEWKEYIRNVKIQGRGGTDFRPVFELIRQEKENPR